MAGTLVLDTLQNGAGTASTSADNVINGSAKAWVNFNGTGTVAIRASYNVSSITDNGTGQYTINFTNALPDANYAVSLAGITNTSGGGRFINGPSTSAPTTTAFRIYCSQSGVGDVDFEYAYLAVFR
jgi:hypothetical protein